jgi:hypothetical protein
MASGQTIPVLKEALVQLTLGRSTNLGVHRQDHRRIHRGTSCELTTRRWLGAPCATTGQRRGVVMEFRSTTTIIQPYSSQWRGDTCSMSKGGGCATRAPPGGSEQFCGTQSEDFPLRTLHSQDPGSNSTEGECQNHECEQQRPAGRTTLGCCEPVTWAAPIDDLTPKSQRTRGFCGQLQGVL